MIESDPDLSEPLALEGGEQASHLKAEGDRNRPFKQPYVASSHFITLRDMGVRKRGY
jgi:hypothetical protein